MALHCFQEKGLDTFPARMSYFSPEMSDRWHTILNVVGISLEEEVLKKCMFINHLRWPIAAGRSLVYSAFRQVKAFFSHVVSNTTWWTYGTHSRRFVTFFSFFLFFRCTFLFYYPAERRKKMRGFTSIGSLLLLPAFFVRGLILHTTSSRFFLQVGFSI